ncbi:ribonuclease H-like protein [Nadsonia fulvescens var. elongata DSM 6958]|uniref:poly(A)-specific ribonuclease n=1 Tax=Nadsonia fulvescens var. elongata DSM 6958 TaxID=857566 RepID=A0A1E3PLC8_9ASCO|nr:ribonuclease H-like protein [Nadsonia fulvescens var. elongata DSM 6958]
MMRTNFAPHMTANANNQPMGMSMMGNPGSGLAMNVNQQVNGGAGSYGYPGPQQPGQQQQQQQSGPQQQPGQPQLGTGQQPGMVTGGYGTGGSRINTSQIQPQGSQQISDTNQQAQMRNNSNSSNVSNSQAFLRLLQVQQQQHQQTHASQQQQQQQVHTPQQQQALLDLQQQLVYNNVNSLNPGNGSRLIQEVWAWNFEEEMKKVRDVIENYKVISLDCKFPGIVARPIGTFHTTNEYHYQTLRSNADLLKVIQIGLCFSDEFGNRPNDISTWQFNFKFSEVEDMCGSEMIHLLKQSGVDLPRHEREGIDRFEFGELLISSGLVLDDSTAWVSFHSGYDLGYILSIVFNKELPVLESDFRKMLHKYFANVWDIKYMVKALRLSNSPTIDLHELAEEFHLAKIGVAPGGGNGANGAGGAQSGNGAGNNELSGLGLGPSGPDARLTSDIYFEIKRYLGMAQLPVEMKNKLFGLSNDLDYEDGEDEYNNSNEHYEDETESSREDENSNQQQQHNQHNLEYASPSSSHPEDSEEANNTNLGHSNHGSRGSSGVVKQDAAAVFQHGKMGGI